MRITPTGECLVALTYYEYLRHLTHTDADALARKIPGAREKVMESGHLTAVELADKVNEELMAFFREG